MRDVNKAMRRLEQWVHVSLLSACIPTDLPLFLGTSDGTPGGGFKGVSAPVLILLLNMVMKALCEPSKAAVMISSLTGEACEWAASVFPQRSDRTETADGFIASFWARFHPVARKECAKSLQSWGCVCGWLYSQCFGGNSNLVQIRFGSQYNSCCLLDIAYNITDDSSNLSQSNPHKSRNREKD